MVSGRALLLKIAKGPPCPGRPFAKRGRIPLPGLDATFSRREQTKRQSPPVMAGFVSFSTPKLRISGWHIKHAKYL
jgi:hypothetical protein